jgi:cell division protein FtsZ
LKKKYDGVNYINRIMANAKKKNIKNVKPQKRPVLRKQKNKKIAKKVVKKTASPKIEKASVKDFTAEALFKARIKVIGIGGGGGSIVSEIGRSLEKANFVIADTDIRALKKKSGIKYLWFGEEFTHGLGTGVNTELAKQAAESAKEKISQNFKDQDIVIFIASLGGGLGSGATQVFVDAAKEFGGITFGIFTMPFKFEGKNKYKIAQNALKTLRQSLNVSLVIPNERIFKVIDTNTAITDAFSMVNRSLIESLESLIDLIYNPGIINIDFADFRTILKGVGNTAFLNTIEESGKNRADKICEKILSNPLLQNNGFRAEKILFNVAGSDNLSMFEVERISSHISSANPEAKIIFGISKNSKLKNKVKTTILMTGGGEGGSLPAKKPETVKEAIKSEKIKLAKVKAKKAEKPVKAVKKPKVKKEAKKAKSKQKPISIPVLSPEITIPTVPVMARNRLANIIEEESEISKRGMRRSALEAKKAEEMEEKKRIAQEKEWEIPAFLRRVKFKS